MAQDTQHPPSDPAEQLVVDFSVRIGNWTYAVGWAGPRVSGLAAQAGETPLAGETDHFDRPDVAAVYGLASGRDLGFVLAISDGGDDLSLTWSTPSAPGPQRIGLDPTDRPSKSQLANLEPILGTRVARLPPKSPDWVKHMMMLSARSSGDRTVRGCLDKLLQHETLGCVAFGWCVGEDDQALYLLDAEDQLIELADPFRFPRTDLADMKGVGRNQVAGAGFLARAAADIVPPVRLIAATDSTFSVLGAPMEPEPLTDDPKLAAQALFDLLTPISSFSRRVQEIDWPILTPIIEKDHAQWEAAGVTGRDIGPQPEQPEVSLIIPLYGRHDFVEHQLMEFCRDPYMRTHAEIIYVLDDPMIFDAFTMELHELHNLYGQPFRWVWGSVNRGFSGANNLGTAHARAPRLLFMNSDVFPQEPGWLPKMVEALDSNPEIGLVAPRLLFANGGLQHAGMVQRRLDAFDLWINHHPLMGFDPSLDPRTALDTVPLVTGACVLARKAEIETLGGWDTGYLIGDYEDSDLCYKYRAAGFGIGYLPTVSLVHLERQSFSQIGTDNFRMRMTIANSTRHAARWPDFLRDAQAADTNGAAQ